MKKFNTKIDKFTLKITYVFLCFVFLLTVFSIFNSIQKLLLGKYYLALLFITILLIISVIVSLIYKPVYYTIDRKTLIINRRIGNLMIPLKEISNIQLLDNERTKSLWRVIGIGGVFGWVGKFWTKKLGFVNMNSTRTTELILIELYNKKKFLISPVQIDEFILEIKNKLH